MPTTHFSSTKPDAGRVTPSANGSLLDTRSLAKEDILTLFLRATELEALGKKFGNFYDPANPKTSRVIALMFFEPSTRTRMSFQTACYRLGHQCLAMESLSGSSLSKGETYEDTILNVAAMKPDAMVVRYGRSTELESLLPNLPFPVLNAGCGTLAHPTQALLDAYTIFKERGTVEGQKILLVGDIRHSRVAKSNFDVLAKLGADLGVCGPDDFLPLEPPGDGGSSAPAYRVFKSLDEGTAWASVYMGLRIQLERHEDVDSAHSAASLERYRNEYHEQFGLNSKRLKLLGKGAIIMHPGPINHGVEFANEVVKDSRSRIMEQVKNGVLIRAALLSRLWEN